VKRHLEDAPVLDDGSDRRVLRRDQSGRSRNLNRLAHLSNLQSEIQTRRLLDLQLDIVLCDRAEARQFYLDAVQARLQAGEVVDGGLIADHCASCIRGLIGHRDHRAGNDGTARVADDAADVCLSLGNRGYYTQKNNTQYMPKTKSAHSFLRL